MLIMINYFFFFNYNFFRQVSNEEGEILCTEYSELMTTYLGEVSAADQVVSQIFVDLYRWLKKTRSPQKNTVPSLLDRVVIGIKGSTSNGININ